MHSVQESKRHYFYGTSRLPEGSRLITISHLSLDLFSCRTILIAMPSSMCQQYEINREINYIYCI